jgi:chaperone required for assembly of F1-ATPase
MHVPQPETSLAALRAEIEPLDAFRLAALHVMTTLTGSALLPLAVARAQLSPEAAWNAAHVDEDWQISQWGEDEEAKLRRQSRKRDFDAAAKLLELY